MLVRLTGMINLPLYKNVNDLRLCASIDCEMPATEDGSSQ
jgi:hypothetical protein